MMDEQALTGGNVTEIVRIGNTVHRSISPGADGTHALLRFLAERGFNGAPRFLGIDEQGREILSFIEGYVPATAAEEPRLQDDGTLASVARLARQVHDLTAGTRFAGDGEVLCHHDLSPGNTVYREIDGRLQAIAFIDWDLCDAGRRIEDVAHICWQYLDLGPSITDIPEALRQMSVIADAYGLNDRADLAHEVVAWQTRCADGIDTGALAGEAPLIRLGESGVPRRIREAARWVERNVVPRWENV